MILETWFPKIIGISKTDVLPNLEFIKLESNIKLLFTIHGYKTDSILSVKSLHKTHDRLHCEDNFQLLADKIMKKTKEFASSLGYSNKIVDNFYYKNMWANISHEGDFNFPHTHGNSLISGAFYVKCHPGNRIRFFNKLDDMMLAPDIKNEINSDYCEYDCIPNRLILFKSDFLHGNPKQESGEKIVISFNIGV